MLNAGDIVIVKFPYADSNGSKYRPALVISQKSFHRAHRLCWAVMITSTENEPWPGDIRLPAGQTGLRKPSVIRPAKIATIAVDKVEKIGVVSTGINQKIIGFVHKSLAEQMRAGQ